MGSDDKLHKIHHGPERLPWPQGYGSLRRPLWVPTWGGMNTYGKQSNCKTRGSLESCDPPCGVWGQAWGVQ